MKNVLAKQVSDLLAKKIWQELKLENSVSRPTKHVAALPSLWACA
jgi:hypothetical protein